MKQTENLGRVADGAREAAAEELAPSVIVLDEIDSLLPVCDSVEGNCGFYILTSDRSKGTRTFA